MFHWWVGRSQLQDCRTPAPVVRFDANFWLKILYLRLQSSCCDWDRWVESVLKHVHVDYVMTLLNIFWIAQEGQLRKHIIATITSRFASSLLRHRQIIHVFVTSQTQLTSCLVSINPSLMSRTLSAPRLQSHRSSCLIWCKLLIKNLKPSFPIFLL